MHFFNKIFAQNWTCLKTSNSKVLKRLIFIFEHFQYHFKNHSKIYFNFLNKFYGRSVLPVLIYFYVYSFCSVYTQSQRVLAHIEQIHFLTLSFRISLDFLVVTLVSTFTHISTLHFSFALFADITTYTARSLPYHTGSIAAIVSAVVLRQPAFYRRSRVPAPLVSAHLPTKTRQKP